MVALTTLEYPLLCLFGPTASGKSALALEIASRFVSCGKKAAIINSDAVQLYSQIPILSGMPSAEEQSEQPHYLYGILSADEHTSVAWWGEKCAEIIRSLWATEIMPIVVGGTGMYMQGLLEGLSPVPAVNEVIRWEVKADLERRGLQTLHQELMIYDPHIAAKLSSGDQQRILRAIEVFRGTQRPLSIWQSLERERLLPEAQTLLLKICPLREDVYTKATARFHAACRHGALEEVATLMKKYPCWEDIRVQALGMEEIRNYHLKQCDEATMLAEGAKHIRHYAKRQFTWCRHQLTKTLCVMVEDAAKHRQIVWDCVEDWWYCATT